MSTARTAALALGAFIGFGYLVNAAQHADAAGPVATNAIGIPPRSLGAYHAAIPELPADCRARWQIIAGVHATESGHGTFSGDGVDRSAGPLPDGKAIAPIIGPALDGGQFALIWDTDGGKLDGDTVYDRAVGFGQAIPETWRRVMVGRPGADPQDIDDAAIFTGLELCRAGGDLSNDTNLRRALYAYNQDDAYVAEVMARIHGYDAAGPQGTPTVTSGDGQVSLDDVVDYTRSKLDRVWQGTEQRTDDDNVVMRWLQAPVRAIIGDGGESKPVTGAAGEHSMPLAGVTAADVDTTHHDYPAWDLGIDEGTPLTAVASGTATVIDDPAGCGNGVRIVTADGWAWTACHLSAATVTDGQQVAAGQPIGRSGNTGHSTGPHLHLQVRNPSGDLICPQPALAGWLRGDLDAEPAGTACTH